MRRLVFLSILLPCLCPCLSFGEEGIERLLRAGSKLYALSTEAVLKHDQQQTWRRISKEDSSVLRCARETIFDLPVLEGLMRFQDKRLSQLDLSLFNRGEVGTAVDEAFFKQLTFHIDNKISRTVGRLPATLPDKRLGGMRITRRAWVFGAHRLELAWSAEEAPFRAEYIRLKIGPHDPRNDPYKTAMVAGNKPAPLVNAIALRKRSSKQANGDIGIRGLPMVAQRKSYCAVATCERILRYYGRDVTQDQLAQAADADRNLGTNRSKLIDSLRSLGRPLNIRLGVLYHLEGDEMKRLLKDYNRVASKAQKPVFNDAAITFSPLFYQHADPVLLKQARLRLASSRDAFAKDIKKHVDAGVPLMWTVMLGVVPEGGLNQLQGGHMRTILGYNSAKKELIFSDTWGTGHEWKRMPIDEAWTITTGLFSLIPDNIRL